MAFNAYTGGPASAAVPQAPAAGTPSKAKGSSPSFTGGLPMPAGAAGKKSRPAQRRKAGSSQTPGMARRGPQSPFPTEAPLPTSSLAPEAGVPGVSDIGLAASMSRYPGVGPPGATNNMPRRKRDIYGA